MLTFFVRRLLYGFTVLFGVITLVFFLFGLVPDPARELAGQTESEEVVQAIRKKFRLDLPLGERYVLFLNDLSPIGIYDLDKEALNSIDDLAISHTVLVSGAEKVWVLKPPYLGRSFLSERSVSAILAESLPGTFILAFASIAFAMLTGILLGIISALNAGGFADRMILLFSSIGMSGPSFFMAILIAWIGGYLWHDEVHFSIWLIAFIALAIAMNRSGLLKTRRAKQLGWGGIVTTCILLWMLFPASLRLPGTGLPMNGSLYEVDVWQGKKLALSHLILPALTLGIRPLAVISQLLRNSMLEVMGQEYVRTARAKGLSERAVILRHVLRNALNPVVTAASGWLASMLAGAVFVEYVFGWKGLGLEVFRSLEKNDLPVVMGAVIVIAAIFVVINTLTDLLYAWIDPRVRLNG